MNNLFRQAQQLLKTKGRSEMTEEEQEIVTAAEIPLTILPRYNDVTTEEGLEELAKLLEEVTMKLQKAIEKVDTYIKVNHQFRDPDFSDALKLGTEAIKRLQLIRKGIDLAEGELLPGETED